MVAVGVVGFMNGDPHKLLYATDLHGNVCGTGGYGQYIWYPEDAVVQAASSASSSSSLVGVAQLTGFCVATCPSAANLTLDYAGKYVDGITPPCADAYSCGYGCRCPAATVPTADDFFRCIWTGASANTTAFIADDDRSLFHRASQAIAGIVELRVPLLAVGFGAAPLLCTAYLLLLIHCGRALVWGSLAAVFAALCLATALAGCMGDLWSLGALAASPTAQRLLNATGLNAAAADPGSPVGAALACEPGEYETAWHAVAAALGAAALVQACVCCCLCSRIRLAVGILRETSHAVLALGPGLLLFPLLPVLGHLAFVAFWAAALAHVYTTTDEQLVATVGGQVADLTGGLGDIAAGVGVGGVGEVNITDSDGFIELTPQQDPIAYSIWVYVFWYFWSAEVMAAFSTIVVAGAVGRWYWAGGRQDGDRARLLAEGGGACGCFGGLCGGGAAAVGAAAWRAVRYHLGTIVGGALLVAVVRFVRAVLSYIQKRTAGTESRAVKAALWVLQCCLWCLQKVLVFINKNAYVVTAVEGTGFMPSTRKAFGLLLANVARVGTVAYVSYFVLLLGRCLVATGCLLAGYFWIGSIVDGDQHSQQQKHYEPFWAYVLCFIVPYAVACAMVAVYDTAVDTILLCLLMDEDANKDFGGDAYFAPRSLVKFLADDCRGTAFACDENAERELERKRRREEDGPASPLHRAKAAVSGTGVDFTGAAASTPAGTYQPPNQKVVGEI